MKHTKLYVLIVLTIALSTQACERCSEKPLTPEEAARRERDDAFWQEFGQVFAPIIATHAQRCPDLRNLDMNELAQNLIRASRRFFDRSPLPRCGPGLVNLPTPCKTTEQALFQFYEIGYMGQEFNWSCEELRAVVRGDQPAFTPIVR